MKKQLLLIVALLICLAGLPTICSAAIQASGENTSKEAVIQNLLARTYLTKMLFKGGNANWDCYLKVVDTVKNNGSGNSARIKFALYPKCMDSTIYNYTRRFNYNISYSKSWFSGEHWLNSGQEIIVESNAPSPDPREQVQMKVVEWSNEEQFTLVNAVPADNVISPEQACRRAYEVYFTYYGAYPDAQVLLEIEFYDDSYWLVSFDDKDGIGGKAYLLVDAYTGKAAEMKEDE